MIPRTWWLLNAPRRLPVVAALLACAVVFALGGGTALAQEEPPAPFPPYQSNEALPESAPAAPAPAPEAPAPEAIAPASPALDPITVPLDVLLLQDETGSMGDDIGQLRLLAPEIWNAVASRVTIEARIGVAGFRDYARGWWGSEGDWVYQEYTPLTARFDSFNAGVNTLSAWGGNDGPEAQLAALDYLLNAAAGCIDSNGDGDCTDFNDTPAGRQPAFRSSARRVILLATDAPFNSPETAAEYPGPSFAQVKERLIASGAILIGLAPYGPGYIPQLDELAAATGGRTFSTGSSGQDIVQAIVDALGSLRPVSPSLSTITALPESAVANGIAPISITVTLRDTGNAPVRGQTVRLTTSRPDVDLITQPLLKTDAEGRASGVVRSTAAGVSEIGAESLTAAVSLEAHAIVAFTPASTLPGDELTNAIRFAQEYGGRALGDVSDKALEIAQHGEYFRAAQTTDAIKLAVDAGMALWDGYGFSKEMAKPLVMARFSSLMEVHGPGFAYFETFTAEFLDPGKLFDLSLRKAIEAGDTTLLRHTLQWGWTYLVARSAGDALKDLGAGVVESKLSGMVRTPNWMSEIAQDLQDDIAVMEDDLVDHGDTLLRGIPALSTPQQRAYATDISARVSAATALATSVWEQELLLANLRAAHTAGDLTSGQAALLFGLKMFGKALATPYPLASAAMIAVPAAIDLRKDMKALEISGKGFVLAQGGLSSAAETAGDIFLNLSSGFANVEAAAPIHRVQGEIVSVTHFVDGRPWYAFWEQRNAYSQVTIRNTGAVPATFSVMTTYRFVDHIFGVVPNGLITPILHNSVWLEPGAQTTLRIDYKSEEFGHSPDDDSPISMVLFARAGFGIYAADRAPTLFDPTRLVAAADGGMMAAASDAPTVETPIDLYVLPTLQPDRYIVQLWLTNPFTRSIEISVTQPLPAAAVQAAEGLITGSTLDWSGVLDARDSRLITYAVTIDGPLGVDVAVPAATLSFVYPETDVAMETVSNEAPFVHGTTLTARFAAVTGHAAFKAGRFSTALSNWGTEALALTARIRLVRADGVAVYSVAQPLTLEPGAESVLAWTLPASIPPGDYRLDLVASDGVGETPLSATPYTITGARVLLPLIDGE